MTKFTQLSDRWTLQTIFYGVLKNQNTTKNETRFSLVPRGFSYILVYVGPSAEPQPAIATTEKICLIIRARRWAATAMSGTRGVCVVSAGQAPYRARSMRAPGGDIFNGVTQNASCHITLCISRASDTSLFAFQSSANSRVTVTVPPHHRVGSRGRARG